MGLFGVRGHTSAYASQQPTLDANQTSYAPKGYERLEDGSDGDSNDDGFSVVAQCQGDYGSGKSKSEDGRVARWLDAVGGGCGGRI